LEISGALFVSDLKMSELVCEEIACESRTIQYPVCRPNFAGILPQSRSTGIYPVWVMIAAGNRMRNNRNMKDKSAFPTREANYFSCGLSGMQSQFRDIR